MNVSRQPYEKNVRLKWPTRRKYMKKGPGPAQKVGTNCPPPYAQNWWIRLRAAIISVTTEIAREKDTQGFKRNRTAAREGGHIAGKARRALEAKTSTPVVSSENFLNPPPKRFSETAATSFIETQGKVSAPDVKDLPKTRRRLKRKVFKTIKDMGNTMQKDLPGPEKKAKRLGQGKKKQEGGE